MDSRATFNYMSKLLSNAAGITVLILLSCTSAPRAVHVSRGAGLIGKATQELLSCAGTPLRETHTGSGTGLKYYKEAPGDRGDLRICSDASGRRRPLRGDL